LKKRDLRHGLNELLALVKEKGVPISEQAFGLIVLLNKQHKEHSLRYSFLVEGEGSVFTPRAEEMFLLLEELLMAGRISTFGV
ncbi:MAG TPA: hypothetical protein VK025_03835, partial [Steroidobacter sp.]|nr:hypothetical protein [Steroidobacter sp.]